MRELKKKSLKRDFFFLPHLHYYYYVAKGGQQIDPKSTLIEETLCKDQSKRTTKIQSQKNEKYSFERIFFIFII
jgi:hypothetical protein